MDDPIKCKRCGRTYRYNFCLATMPETLQSQRVKRPACDYCQKPSVYTETPIALVRRARKAIPLSLV